MRSSFVIETDLHDGLPTDWHRWSERDFTNSGRSAERPMTPRYESRCVERLRAVSEEMRVHFRLRDLDAGTGRPYSV